jgi:hypothetical protein
VSEPTMRNAADGLLKEMVWHSPSGHFAGARVYRAYEVELVYDSGTRRCVQTGPNLKVAQALAESPAQWDPPGSPGIIRYRDEVTLTGPWTLLEPLDLQDDTPDGEQPAEEPAACKDRRENCDLDAACCQGGAS